MSATPTSIPEKSWTNPFPEGHPLHTLFRRRIRNHQDLVILLDDWHARRGTGKTVASLQLANGMDQQGGLTRENVTLAPQEIRNAYSTLPTRSGLVLDEGEVGASNRQAMSKVNQALREILSMGRVEEKYVVINAPAIGFLDKDVRLLADVWITMLQKGIGLVHFLERQPYAREGQGKLLTKKKAMIQFKDIQRGTPLRRLYNQLTEEKKRHIRGEEGGGFVRRDEHEEALTKREDAVERETRNRLIVSTMNSPDIDATQAAVADAFGVSQSMVSQLLKDNQ